MVTTVIIKENKILCTQRNKQTTLPLLREIPGGKIEELETQKDALKRESLEEMQCEIEIGDKIVTIVHKYEFAIIESSTFYSTKINDRINLNEHAYMKWLPPLELNKLKWAPADIETVNLIMKKFINN